MDLHIVLVDHLQKTKKECQNLRIKGLSIKLDEACF